MIDVKEKDFAETIVDREKKAFAVAVIVVVAVVVSPVAVANKRGVAIVGKREKNCCSCLIG